MSSLMAFSAQPHHIKAVFFRVAIVVMCLNAAFRITTRRTCAGLDNFALGERFSKSRVRSQLVTKTAFFSILAHALALVFSPLSALFFRHIGQTFAQVCRCFISISPAPLSMVSVSGNTFFFGILHGSYYRTEWCTR